MIILERELVERVAKIIGPQSAAAQALADADKRIAEGHDVVFVKDGDSILVVDEDRLTPEQREKFERYEEQQDQYARWDAEDRATRRMESGGYDY